MFLLRVLSPLPRLVVVERVLRIGACEWLSSALRLRRLSLGATSRVGSRVGKAREGAPSRLPI
jgi:hypothetical protein